MPGRRTLATTNVPGGSTDRRLPATYLVLTNLRGGGGYGWIRLSAVSAAKRASGADVSFASSLASSITAAIGVLNWKRRPMSSLARAIVACAFRVSAPASRRDVPDSATSPTIRHSRRTKRVMPSIPDGVHSMS